MTSQDLIKKIFAKNPELTPGQLAEKVQAEKARSGGLLGDETILRLIAARYGVEIEQNSIQFSGTLSSSRLLAGLNDVTVAGRLIAVFPVRTFEGEKSGKFATLMIVDNDGILRVVLWNKKAELVEQGELKAGQAVRLMHGYTRGDRYGKVELHLGEKAQIEFEPTEKASQYPNLENFSTKISELTQSSGTVNLCASVKQVLKSSTFTRSDATEGNLLRFVLSDDSGEVTAVAWNEKAAEIEKALKANTRLQLVNARVKEGMNGGFEVHIDSNTFVDFGV